jgi:hypothetical protein
MQALLRPAMATRERKGTHHCLHRSNMTTRTGQIILQIPYYKPLNHITLQATIRCIYITSSGGGGSDGGSDGRQLQATIRCILYITLYMTSSGDSGSGGGSGDGSGSGSDGRQVQATIR